MNVHTATAIAEERSDAADSQANPPGILLCSPCLRPGGTEIQTLSLAKALMAEGWRARVVVYFDETDPGMRAAFENAGAEVVQLRLSRGDGLARLLRRLVEFLRDSRPPVVHVQYIAPGFVPVAAARIAGYCRVAATVHQSAAGHGLMARLLLRTAAMMCDVFVSNSLSTEKSWFGESRLYDAESRRQPRRHCTVYNGVDVDGIAAAASDADRARILGGMGFTRTPVVGVVGRLRGEKGQETAIRAMPSLLTHSPSAGLLLVGDGPDRGKLEALSRDLGLDQAVRFTGALPQAEIHAVYGAMDVLAVPSEREGFCLAAAEAMAARVPVVASDIPALGELLEGGKAGMLTPQGDAEALASCVARVLADGSLSARIREEGFARVSRTFSMQRFNYNAAALHRSLLAAGKVTSRPPA